MVDISSITQIFDPIRPLLIHSTPDLPAEAWWLPGTIIVLLGIASAIDAFKAIVPYQVIVIGLFITIAALGFDVSWPYSARQLAWGIGSAVALWAINELWFQFFAHEAIGMGDAKWTLLAVTCFGIMPVLFAWGFGACIAVLWLGVLFVTKHKSKHVHFAPFLFIGLLAGLYWLRLRA